MNQSKKRQIERFSKQIAERKAKAKHIRNSIPDKMLGDDYNWLNK